MINKIIIILLLAVIIGAFVWWIISVYNFATVATPAQGGKYIEGFVGQPRYINPLLSHSSSSDRNLTKLIFSGLFDYDESGILRNDIAERYEISEDGKEYTIFLRQDVKWHDDVNVTANDVVFTLNIAKDVTYGAAGVSNNMRLVWHDIDIEKVDDYTVKFKLKEVDSNFIHDLTLGLLPKHIWESVEPEQFQISEYNQKPIGSGPYKFVDLSIDVENDVINSYTLRSNSQYYRGEPLITKVITNFYPTRGEAIEAYKNGEVSGVMVDKKEYIDELSDSAQKQSIELPHYFAVFLNQIQSAALGYDEVREALAMATNRDEIVFEVFGENATVRKSPFAEGVVGFDSEVDQKGFNVEEANKLLDDKDWKVGDDGIRSKDDTRLAFQLHLSDSHEEVSTVSQMLKEQWMKIGVDVEIVKHEQADLEANIIKPRDYDALLGAHQMNFEPELRPLWHGKEKDDPGLNYALLDNEKMNKSLDDLVAVKNLDEKNEFYKKQQEVFRDEVPAIFLFAPKLAFMHNSVIKNIRANKVNVSYDRYADIQSWYIKESRVLKK